MVTTCCRLWKRSCDRGSLPPPEWSAVGSRYVQGGSLPNTCQQSSNEKRHGVLCVALYDLATGQGKLPPAITATGSRPSGRAADLRAPAPEAARRTNKTRWTRVRLRCTVTSQSLVVVFVCDGAYRMLPRPSHDPARKWWTRKTNPRTSTSATACSPGTPPTQASSSTNIPTQKEPTEPAACSTVTTSPPDDVTTGNSPASPSEIREERVLCSQCSRLFDAHGEHGVLDRHDGRRNHQGQRKK